MKKRMLPGGGIRGGLTVVIVVVFAVVTGVVLLLTSAGFTCTLGGLGGGDVRDVDGGVDRTTGTLPGPVNCTGNIRVAGTGVC